MCNKEKIELLNGYRFCSMKMIRLEAEMEELLELFEKARKYIDKFQKTKLYDSFLQDFQQLGREKQETIRKQNQIKAIIEAVDDQDGRKLLTLRYINCMEWEKIARLMYLSVDHAKGALHRKVLSHIQI